MRFILWLSLLALFPIEVQADEWYQYIQVECDVEKKIFEVRSLSVGQATEDGRLVPNLKSIKTSGNIYAKNAGVKWAESENGNVITVKESLLEIPDCVITENHETLKTENDGKIYPNGIFITEQSEVVFKVVRTGIDQGNVQRRCGAANSAEFTVYVNDVALGKYPSSKQLCFNNAKNSQTVSYSPEGLRHCERPQSITTSVLGGKSFKTYIAICHQGAAMDYLKYSRNLGLTNSEKRPSDVVTRTRSTQIKSNYDSLRNLAQSTELKLQNETRKSVELSSSLERIAKENEALHISVEELKQELKKSRHSSFWKRIFSKTD